ncbi:MAG: NeuD/PglB/VioB family sugar acetyltransferase [Aestuariivirga sp.]
MSSSVETPRINSNEDQLQVIEIRVAAGDRVEKGDTLFVLETTKAAVEVNAPEAGIINAFTAKIGEFVEVGSTLCKISDDTGIIPGAATPDAQKYSGETRITAKARKRAVTLGVDLATVMPMNGRIGEAEVQSAADSRPSLQSRATDICNSRRAIIIGGGGHAACLIDALQGSGYKIVGCTDEALPIGQNVCAGVSIIGKVDCLERLRSEGVAYAFIGIGGAISSETRRKVYEHAISLGFQIPTIIHPRAVVSMDCHIGDGCHILAGAIIGPRCSVGRNVIINQGSIVCHDSVVSDHAHLAPGATLAGGVRVGNMSVVGMAVTVLLKTTIGSNVLIHNGAHIKTDVANNMIVDAQGKRYLRS